MKPFKIVRCQTIFKQRTAEDLGITDHGNDRLGRDRVILSPILHMFFRPEEIHATSGHAPGGVSTQGFSQGSIDVSDGCLGIYLKNILIAHAYEDRLSAIQATGLDTNLLIRKEPAHGQHFEPSLTVPALFSIHAHQIWGRHIGKRRPGFHIIRIFDEPACQRRSSRFMLHLPRFLGRNA